MTTMTAIVIGVTTVLSVLVWKVGDVLRDWMAVRRLDVERELSRCLFLANDADDNATKAIARVTEIEALVTKQRTEIAKQSDDIERLKVRSVSRV
jgi:hypothetical protein